MSNLVYLISSLPALSYGQVPPISIDNFHAQSKDQLSSKQFDKLLDLDLKSFEESKTRKLKKFVDLIEQLNSDLKEIRTAKKGDRIPALQLLSKTVLDQNPLEREQSIMKWQWEQLTNIDATETFTLAELFVYKLKLQILVRLDSFSTNKGMELMEKIVAPPKKMEDD